MTELDLSWNRQLISLPAGLQQGLGKLQKLSLIACESLDFATLSTFLNGSGVTELDLSQTKPTSLPDNFFSSLSRLKILNLSRENLFVLLSLI